MASEARAFKTLPGLFAAGAILLSFAPGVWARSGMPASRGAAAGGDADGYGLDRDEAAAPELKEPRFWFGRPDKDTAAEQLAHASRPRRPGASAPRKAYDALVHEWGDAPEAAEAARRRGPRGRGHQPFREYQYFIEPRQRRRSQRPWYQKVVSSSRRRQLLRDKLGGGWFSSPDVELAVHVPPHRPQRARMELPRVRCSKAPPTNPRMDAEAIVTTTRWRAATASGLRRTPPRAGRRYRIPEKFPRDERSTTRWPRSPAPTGGSVATMAETASKQIAELSRRRATMLFERAEFYDRIRDNPQAALIAYEQFLATCPASAEAPWVRDRVAQLKTLTGPAGADASK